MPNRILKESICSSETIDNLTLFEEVFFYRLIVNCDDYGCFDARSKILKSRLFPLKDIRDKQIEDALSKLSLAGIVVLYECDGRPYLQLAKWELHQQVRAKKSKYPKPGDNGVKMIDTASNRYSLISSDINGYQPISDAPVIQSNPNPNLNPKNTMCKADALALFERLWKLYPSKKGKGQVSDKAKLRLLEIGEEHIIRCIDRYKAELAKDADWRQPQNGSTFFTSGYVDYLDENYEPGKPAQKQNQFNNYQQSSYDYADLDKIISNKS